MGHGGPCRTPAALTLSETSDTDVREPPMASALQLSKTKVQI